MLKSPVINSGPSITASSLVLAMAGESRSRMKKIREQLEGLGKAAVPALKKALVNWDSPEIRWEAARALGTIADLSSVKALVAAMEDKEQDVSRIAAESLVSFGDDAVRPVLKVFLRSPNSPGLRFGTRHILRRRLQKGPNESYSAVLEAIENGATYEAAAIAALAALKTRP